MNFDILNLIETSISLKIEANKTKSLRKSEIKRYGVRRFEDGKLYQSSCLGEAQEDKLLSDNKKWGGSGIPHQYGFAPKRKENRTGAMLESDLIYHFEEQAHQLFDKFPGYVFSGKCSINYNQTHLYSNYGLDLKSEGGVCSAYLMYQRKASGNMIDGIISTTSANPNFRQMLEDYSEFLEAEKFEAKVSPGKMPVLFVDPSGALKKLKESILINRYKEGAALFSGQLGKRIFSKQVTIYDKAYAPEVGLIDYFDGEGTVRDNDDYVIVDKGEFSGLISDLRFAQKYGEMSSGNGLRTYNSGVNLTPRTLIFANGTKPWRQLVKNLDKCLIAVIAAGGDSNDLGEFSTPVQVGYVFEKGQLVGRSPQVTVKTKLSDFLNHSLVGIASDNFTPKSISGSVISEMDVYLN
jgi:predicted Zn-dependent protease